MISHSHHTMKIAMGTTIALAALMIASCRAFVRLRSGQSPGKSALQATVRRVQAQTLKPSKSLAFRIFHANPHTDIIVKSFRDVQYGHKINLATERRGFVTCLSIEEGNPADASQANVHNARVLGVKRTVFNKPAGLGLHAMGVKQKTFDALRDFRAGIEGNISELKRAFGLSRATWKGYDGFLAYVWSSVLSYNLVRRVRFSSA